MLKLLICLLFSVGLGAIILQLREQRLNLTYQVNELHNRIESSQAKLWNQQLDIAVCTAPNAIAATLKGQDLKMTAPPAAPGGPRNWIATPDAGE